MNVIKCISHVKWGADRVTLLRLFTALIQSKLDYGCQAYGLAKANDLKRLDPVLNMGLRLALGAFKSSRVTSLTVEAGVPPLKYRRQFLIGKQLLKYKQLEGNNNMVKSILERDIECTSTFTSVASSIIHEVYPTNPHVAKMDKFPPPWNRIPTEFCRELTNQLKEETPVSVMRSLFDDHKDTHRGSQPVYTDGSKMDGYVGYAAVFVEQTSKFKLHPHASIYTAELLAIKRALREAETNGWPSITIYSDSRSSLEGISKGRIDHPIVLDLLRNRYQI